MPAKKKNKGSWRQFDSKRGGGDGEGTKIKTIIISFFFTITMLISFILIVLSFSQIGNHGKLWDGTEDICFINDTQKPTRWLVPKVSSPITNPTPAPPTPEPTPAPTDPPPPPATTDAATTDASTTAAATTDASTTDASTTDASTTDASTTTDAPTTDASTTTDAPTTDASTTGDGRRSHGLREHVPDPRAWLDKSHVIQCPWPRHSSILRIFANIIGLATCICVFWLVMRSEVWQAFWVCLLSCIGLVVFIFALFVRDANNLSHSRSYCENMEVQLTAEAQAQAGGADITVTCNMSPQVAVGVLNVVWLLWLVDAIILYLYVKKWKVVIYS